MQLKDIINGFENRLDELSIISKEIILDEAIDANFAETVINELKEKVEYKTYQKEEINEIKKKVETPKEAKPIEEKIIPNIGVEWKKSKSLIELDGLINNCLNCRLGQTRNQFVFGTGNPNADILIIGEAPGADEDKQGVPFVGRGGKLLTDILKAIDFKREEVFIANIIKCRPPENRRPLEDEVHQCEPYLQKQIELINPKFILALGLTAIDTLLKDKHKMADTRGKLIKYKGRILITTYHPAALLRNPALKKETWKDVQMLRDLYKDFKNNQLNLKEEEFLKTYN